MFFLRCSAVVEIEPHGLIGKVLLKADIPVINDFYFRIC